MSECLQIIRLESKCDQNPSFTIRLGNKYDQEPSFCDVMIFLFMSVINVTIDILEYLDRFHFFSCAPFTTLRLVLFVLTDVTIGVIDLNRRYDRCSRLQPTLQSVISTSTNDRCYRIMALLPM